MEDFRIELQTKTINFYDDQIHKAFKHIINRMIPCLCSAEKEEETDAPNDSYTVENFNGVPFIAKNGKPVRGRMFFGGYPGGNRYTVENDSWSDISIKFISPIRD